MRVCPECRKQYADDVVECPDDGSPLLEADRLPENPALRDVVPVSPTDHTAMIDLEALEAERERRGLNRPEPQQEPDAGRTAEGHAVDEAAAADREHAEEAEEPADPDATGTLHRDDLKSRGLTSRRSATDVTGRTEVDPSRSDTERSSDDGDDDTRIASTEHTEITRRPRPDDPTMGRAAPRGERRSVAGLDLREPRTLAVAAASVVVLTLGLTLGVWWFVSSRGAVLTVTSLPPGATVLLDGKELGTATLQERVSVGSHVIELRLEGYRPFKEVVDVPPEGLPFLQPLEADPDTKAAATTSSDAGPSAEPVAEPIADATDGGAPADELVAHFDELLAGANYDAALELIKDLVRQHPDDTRADELFERLAEARVQAATSTTPGATKPGGRSQGTRKLSPERRQREAREAYATGEALFREGSVDEARARLREAIQLDPRYAAPHRAIARIYERDGDVSRTRYHLDRYLRLGGKDPDYRVRRWLEDNKD